MKYNEIAGQSVDRLAALSDGIFAVAMALLVLNLRIPVGQAIHGEHGLWRALAPRIPQWRFADHIDGPSIFQLVTIRALIGFAVRSSPALG